MQRLTAKELQRRYRAGERNFANVDLSGESLRGLNLKGIDLSGADLSRTDIRGTNFSEANLVGTQFVAAKAGTQRRWLVPQLLIVFMLVAVVSVLVGAFWADLLWAIMRPYGLTSVGPTAIFQYGVSGTVFSLVLLWLIYTKGVLFALVATLGIFVVTLFRLSLQGNFALAVGDAVAVAVIGNITLAIAFTVVFVSAGSTNTASAAIIPAVFDVSQIVAVPHHPRTPILIAGVIVGVLSNLIVNNLIARRAALGDSRDAFVRSIAVWYCSWGGTEFIQSNLTDASFSKAILKSTHLYQANLTRTNFHLSKKVNLARLGKTILSNFQAQNLLITLRGNDKLYIGLNLEGAYLAGAELKNTDFTEADLSNATLEGSTLEQANLTKTQALGTNFHQTILTGATLEAWNIDSTTQLDGAICDYVYLLRNHQERRPNSGSFAPGDFTKLFQEVLDTIDLIFQNGIDWKAFIQTFNQIQVQYEHADLAVQSIENKGDGVVVVKLHAAPGADKPAIHQSFTEIYQLAFAEAEARYKAQLHAKDEQIIDYRQQNANMQEVIKLLAQRPINVDVKATAESKAMQGNDNSRNVNIHGNANHSIIQAGDSNTAEQHITLPPPERVNIQAELAALKEILAGFQRPVIDAVMVEVEEEIAKPNPDKSVVATTLETGLTYARNLQGFAEAMDQLRPHVQNAAGWLGEHGTKLLPLVGLML
jgi:uncharacterized protein YjbI with pentapeptide repeats